MLIIGIIITCTIGVGTHILTGNPIYAMIGYIIGTLLAVGIMNRVYRG